MKPSSREIKRRVEDIKSGKVKGVPAAQAMVNARRALRDRHITDKQLALESIGRLPDDVSLNYIVGRVRFLAGIQKGLDAADRGETMSHKEVKRQLAARLNK